MFKHASQNAILWFQEQFYQPGAGTLCVLTCTVINYTCINKYLNPECWVAALSCNVNFLDVTLFEYVH